MKNFEEKLILMSKPEVSQLKHQDMLAHAITKAKDKAVVSWWWICIPLYITATLLMKSLYMPGTSLLSNIHEFVSKANVASAVWFLISPLGFIILNAISIRNIYLVSGSPKTIQFIRAIWVQALIILFSLFVILIYSL